MHRGRAVWLRSIDVDARFMSVDPALSWRFTASSNRRSAAEAAAGNAEKRTAADAATNATRALTTSL
jgi:hypothetical protein